MRARVDKHSVRAWWRGGCLRLLPRGKAAKGARLHAAFGEAGQASLEYLLVGSVLMIMVVGLAALWRFASDGRFDHLVDTCASHAVSTGGALDVLLF